MEKILISPYAVPGTKSLAMIGKEQIINEVCREYRINPVQLFRKCRQRGVVEPRMVIQTLFRNALGFTLWDTGKEFAQTNASAFHAIKTVRDLYASNVSFRNILYRILENLFEDEIERLKIIERIIDDSKKDEKAYKKLFAKYNCRGAVYPKVLPEDTCQTLSKDAQ